MSLSPGWACSQVLFPQEREEAWCPQPGLKVCGAQQGHEGQQQIKGSRAQFGAMSLSTGSPGAGSRRRFPGGQRCAQDGSHRPRVAGRAAAAPGSLASPGDDSRGCTSHTWSRRAAWGRTWSRRAAWGRTWLQRAAWGHRTEERVSGSSRRTECRGGARGGGWEPLIPSRRAVPPASPAWCPGGEGSPQHRGEASAVIMASPLVMRLLSLAQQEGPTPSQGHFRGFSFRRGKRKSPSWGESACGGKRPPVLRGGQPAWGLHGPSGVKVGVEVLLPPSKRTVCRGPFSLLENSFADGCLGHKAGEVSLIQRGSLSFDPSETLPSGSPDASVLLWTPSNDFTHFYTNV